MARNSSITVPTPADHQQMDRSNDPDLTREMDAAAPEAAMASRRQRLAGSAVGVGSVEFDDPGVFEIAEDHPDEDADAVSAPPSLSDPR